MGGLSDEDKKFGSSASILVDLSRSSIHFIIIDSEVRLVFAVDRYREATFRFGFKQTCLFICTQFVEGVGLLCCLPFSRRQVLSSSSGARASNSNLLAYMIA